MTSREQFLPELAHSILEKKERELKIGFDEENLILVFFLQTENGMQQFNFRLDGLYIAKNNGMDVDEISNRLLHIFDLANKSTLDLEDKFADYEKIRDFLAFRLSEEKMDEEELEKYIFSKEHDVTRILFAYEVDDEGKMQWHKISRNTALNWNKDLTEVTKQVIDNTDTLIPVSTYHCDGLNPKFSPMDMYNFLKSIVFVRISKDLHTFIDDSQIKR